MAEVLSHDQKFAVETIYGGTLTEAIGGAGAVVLTILGLLNVLPVVMLSVATIGVGAGLLFQGSAIGAEYADLIDRAGAGQLHDMNIGGGLSVEILTGGAGVALGILALVGVAPLILTAAGAIVLGCGLAISSGSITRLNHRKIKASGAEIAAQNLAREAVRAASGTQVLVGLGAITLGILGIIGLNPLMLTMIAVLALGGATLLSGMSLNGSMLSIFGN